MAISIGQKFRRSNRAYDQDALMRDLLLLIEELNVEIARLEARIAALE